MISEGYRRNYLSRGGREVFDSATLPGHLNAIHLKTTGHVLQFIDESKCEDELLNHRLKITFGEERARVRDAAAKRQAIAEARKATAAAKKVPEIHNRSRPAAKK